MEKPDGVLGPMCDQRHYVLSIEAVIMLVPPIRQLRPNRLIEWDCRMKIARFWSTHAEWF
jgi:hypothetical protein